MRYICAFHGVYFGMYDLLWHSFKYIDYPNFRYDTQWAFEKEIHSYYNIHNTLCPHLDYDRYLIVCYYFKGILWRWNSMIAVIITIQAWAAIIFCSCDTRHTSKLIINKKSWVINRNNKYKSIINNHNEQCYAREYFNNLYFIFDLLYLG